MTTSIIKGSLGDVAQQSNKSIAETFMNADCIVIVDTSGSMNTADSTNGRKRYDVACEELAKLQGSLPGKIAVLSFSDSVLFCPNGLPIYLGSGTDLAGALRFAKVADVPGAMRFIVISDGEPNAESDALKEAKAYQNRIDVIYVGPEEYPSGRAFLTKLANISGGQAVTADTAQDLAKQAQLLLAGN